jgi:hypothetical protein
VEFGVFGLGLDEDGDVGVGVFPECEGILVGAARGSVVAAGGVGTRQANVSERAKGRIQDNATMVENFLEFGCGFPGLARGQESVTTKVDGT